MAIPLAMVGRACKKIREGEDGAERPREPEKAPEPKEPIPVPPPAQDNVWVFYTANSQAYRVGAKVHAARPGEASSLCNKLRTDKSTSVQRPPEEAICAPCRMAMQKA